MKEKPQVALETAMQALGDKKEIGYARGEALAMTTMVHTCIQRGDAKKAVLLGEQALARFRASGDKKGQAAAHDALMYAYAESRSPIRRCCRLTKRWKS